MAAPHTASTTSRLFVLTRCRRCSPHCMSCRETRPRPCGCRRRPDMLRPSAAAFLPRQYPKGEWEGARRRQLQRACHAPLDTKRKMACSGLSAILCETHSDGRRCKRGQRALRRNGRAGTTRPPQRRVCVCAGTLRITYTNWPTVRSAGTRNFFLSISGSVASRGRFSTMTGMRSGCFAPLGAGGRAGALRGQAAATAARVGSAAAVRTDSERLCPPRLEGVRVSVGHGQGQPGRESSLGHTAKEF